VITGGFKNTPSGITGITGLEKEYFNVLLNKYIL